LTAFLFLSATFVVCYFLLALIQSAFLPKAPNGTEGAWVIRPDRALHFCACAVVSAVTTPFLMAPLRKRWIEEDLVHGSRHDPFHGSRIRWIAVAIQSGALLLIYSAAFVFYLNSWTMVSRAGIDLKLPWGRKHYDFAQIRLLQMVPPAMRSETAAKNGPWYNVEFNDGRAEDFSADNEGLTASEQLAVAEFIAKQCNMAWQIYPDARLPED
jgi:hypothetical protein